jgi:hypothetical protein
MHTTVIIFIIIALVEVTIRNFAVYALMNWDVGRVNKLLSKDFMGTLSAYASRLDERDAFHLPVDCQLQLF